MTTNENDAKLNARKQFIRNILIGFAVLAAIAFIAAMQTEAWKNNRYAKTFGQNCSYVATCGDIAHISCQPEVDGWTYYVNRTTGQVLDTCGGACETKNCSDGCPKPGVWTCLAAGSKTPARSRKEALEKLDAEANP